MKAEISYKGGKQFLTKTRGFEVLTDLPEQKGGTNLAVSPPELFIASLVSCMGVYVSKYLDNINVNAEGLKINVDWDFAESPSRVGNIDVQIKIPENEKLQSRIAAIKKAVEQCPIHNTLNSPPKINISVNKK